MIVIGALCLVVVLLVPGAGRSPRRLGPPPSRPRVSTNPWPTISQQIFRRRHRRRLIGGLPDLVELVARGLRGGANLSGALTDAASGDGSAAASLRSALDRVSRGGRLGDSIDRWADHIDHPDADLVRAVIRFGDQTGGALAGSLDRAAATLRERAALVEEVRALTAQTRASSLVVALAPLGFLGVVATVDAESAIVLFTTPLGLGCLIAGLVLDGLGVVWMIRIAGSVAR